MLGVTGPFLFHLTMQMTIYIYSTLQNAVLWKVVVAKVLFG